MDLSRVPDLDSLQLLLQVAATGSLGQAGKTHGLSQPAVSSRIQGMERLVGLPLVIRAARGSSLTAEGALLAGWAQDVLRAAAELEAGVESLRNSADARLRVAASLTVAEHLLPVWLVRLTAESPDVVVSLAAMNSTDVETAIRDGAADLGFVEGPHVAPDLDARVVARDRLVVVVAPRHPWARRRHPISAEELAATRLVQREPDSGTRQALETALLAFAPLPTPLLELSTTAAVRSAVLAGAGPGVLSALAVDDDVAAGTLVEVPVADVKLDRRLRAVWASGQRPSGPARDLLRIGAATDSAAPRARGTLSR